MVIVVDNAVRDIIPSSSTRSLSKPSRHLVNTNGLARLFSVLVFISATETIVNECSCGVNVGKVSLKEVIKRQMEDGNENLVPIKYKC